MTRLTSDREGVEIKSRGMTLARVTRLAIVGACVGLLAPAAAASGEVRTGSVSDPRDAPPTISGTPDNPDVRHVRVVYDSAGSLTFTIDFYNSIDALDTSQLYAFSGWFSVLYQSPGDPDPLTACGYYGPPGAISGQHHVLHAYGSTFYDRATLDGYNGYLNFDRSISADGKRIALTASSPVLANRDYRCFTYELLGRAHSSIENLNSRYDGACDCWYVSFTADAAGEDWTGVGLPETVWFDGFRPKPPPSPPPSPPAPRVSVSAQDKQSARKLKLKVGCPDRACKINLTGKAVIPTGARYLFRTKRFGLEHQEVDLAAGQTTVLHLDFRKRHAVKEIRELLRKDPRAKRHARVRARVVARGEGGTSKSSEKIRLKP